MAGLLPYGSYVPYHRLQRSEIASVLGDGGGKGMRAVASYDEDSSSMGVEAARRALGGVAGEVRPQRLLFATASPPYLDRTNANVIHAALSLDPCVLAIDVIGSVRSGVGAMLWAMESPASTLVVLSDIRTGLPGSSDEREGGDAAAAFLFGDGGHARTELMAQASMTSEFLDRWRLPDMAASQTWEERFGEFAYGPLADAAFAEALKQCGLTPADIDFLAVAGTHERSMRAFVRDAGVAGVVNDLGLTVGNAGTAHPGLLLADVLDRADPGQVIALVVLADGATAMILRTTDAVALPSGGPTLAAQVAEGHHRSLRYAAFLAWRGFFTREPPRRPDPAGPAAPPSFRPQGYNLDSWAIVVPNVGHCICPQSGSVLNAKPSTRWCRLPCPVPLGR